MRPFYRVSKLKSGIDGKIVSWLGAPVSRFYDLPL